MKQCPKCGSQIDVQEVAETRTMNSDLVAKVAIYLVKCNKCGNFMQLPKDFQPTAKIRHSNKSKKEE